MRTAARTAALLAILTLLSKITGFIREILLAGFFGTGYIVDAYVMANAIPGILFAGIFTSMGVSYLPIYSRIVENEGQSSGDKFTSEAINLATFLALIVAALGIAFAEPVTSVFARGYTGETASLTVFFLRFSFAYLLFTGGASLMESYLHYKGIFLKPMLAGYSQSIFVLGAIVVGAFYSHYVMALGILLGSMARFIIMAFMTRKEGFLYNFSYRIGNTAREIAILALPVFLGSMVNQINSFVDKMLASGLSEGSVSALNYGNLLVGMITALTISIIVTIIYPKLTKTMAAGDYPAFNDALSKGMTIIFIISLPASMGAMLYSEYIVALVYQRGAFDAASTALTGGAFFYYSIGLAFASANSLLVKAYYALEDTKTPVVCGAIGAGSNILFNLLLIGSMAHRGLALATSMAAALNAGMLYYLMRKKYPKIKLSTGRVKMAEITFAALLAVGGSRLVFKALLYGLHLSVVFSMFWTIVAAGLVYLLLLWIFKIEELSLLKDLVK